MAEVGGGRPPARRSDTGKRRASRRASPGGAETLAAVDLGSNSFHMVVARFAHGQLTVVDRLREPVRLAAGIDAAGRLSEERQQAALDCLRRFGQRIRDIRADRVRVVGTSTLRSARAIGRFRQRAARVLGHPIEIISGMEEGRLIYLGASHTLPRSREPQFIVDIGGGSTELILGRGYEPGPRESLALGCVTLTRSAFPDGRLSAKNFRQARIQARLELEPVRLRFARSGALRCAGTSGSIRAAAAVLAAGGQGPLSVDGLEHLIERMIRAGRVQKLRLPGLSRDRVEVFPGGVAILVEILRGLDVPSMLVAEGALREGLLYDLVGRLTDEDARERSVRAMARRYQVDTAQATRVAATALGLFDRVRDAWLVDESLREILARAAALHEIGLDIAHADYHRHGAYVLEHADMPGFPREEQRLLACLVGSHRRRLDLRIFRTLDRTMVGAAVRLAVLLRLAVLFHRSRTSEPLPEVDAHARNNTVALTLPAGWLESNPLTLADLVREQELLLASGIRLRLQRR